MRLLYPDPWPLPLTITFINLPPIHPLTPLPLTLLLPHPKDSLGGNTKTVMIAAISPVYRRERVSIYCPLGFFFSALSSRLFFLGSVVSALPFSQLRLLSPLVFAGSVLCLVFRCLVFSSSSSWPFFSARASRHCLLPSPALSGKGKGKGRGTGKGTGKDKGKGTGKG
jgi:hypothetical protein